MVLRRCLLIILLLVVLPVHAQIVDDAIEQILLEGGTDAEASELSDLLQQYEENPANLNDSAAMASFPFITPFQSKALRNYIILYGELLSVEELFLIPGFDTLFVESLRQYVTAEKIPDKRKWNLSEGKHTIVTGIGGNFEQAKGYETGAYDGDDLRMLLNYRYTYENKLSVRLVADKDPGEVWGSGNYYGYHLMVNGLGRVKSAILGRYNLQFGQGLVLWTGLKPFGIIGNSTVRFGSGIKAASAFYEEGYQDGLAASVDLGRGVTASAFESYTKGQLLTGGHVEYRHGNLVAGFSGQYTKYSDTIEPRDYVYNQHYFRGDRQGAVGLDAMYLWRRALLYGELAIDAEGKCAAVAGVNVSASSDNYFGFAARYFDAEYHNNMAAAYAIGSTQAESGLSMDASFMLPWRIKCLFSADLHNFPTLRYGIYSPSTGAWLRAQLGRQFGERVQLSVRYAYRAKERNVPGAESAEYIQEQTLRQQIQGDTRITLGTWYLTLRACFAQFNSEYKDMQQGWLLYLSATRKMSGGQLSGGLAYFDVDGYYARLYLSENTLQYAWSMPSLNGRGIRGHLVAKWPIGKSLTLAGKYTILYMPGQESIGSGDAQTEGPCRQTYHIQLWYRF